MLTRWHIAASDPTAQRLLMEATGLSPRLCQVLINRGMTDAVTAQAFLSPSLHDLQDPYLLHGMDHAVPRLLTAIRQEEPMAIYGDYDVDGITGTALLVTFFRELGFNVPYYIPERAREGYGVNADAIRQLASQGVQLLITVDCGSTAVEEVALARRLGMETIITDHHQPPPVLPAAVAVLNPHQPACTYPNKHLCGVGMVFKLLTALRAALRHAGVLTSQLPNLKRHLDLVTLGTIADVMPLREENRVLVHYGLQELTQTRKPGLQALRHVSGRTGKTVHVGEVGFQLAPRLNASGRLSSAAHSVALLLASDPQEAARLAQTLDEVNQQRRALQQAVEQAVHSRIAHQYGGSPPAAIIMGDPEWHLGVVGIVASKIAETYHRPTFLLQINGDTARGSGRSIPAFNLYQGLQHCARWLHQFGGHKYAAGLTMEAALLPALQEDFIRFVDDTLGPDDLHPILHLDAVITLQEITTDLIADLARCAPHGPGNPLPLFCAQGLRIVSPIRTLGAQSQHARFRVAQDGSTREVIAFQQAERLVALPAGTVVDIAFTPVINTWRDQHTVELQLRAIRPSERAPTMENH